MKLCRKAASLLLAAGLAATSSEANSSVGQGNLYGIGGPSFGSNGRGYANPTEETLGQDSGSTQMNLIEEQNPLPPGWSEHFDQSSGQYYYYNSMDGTTTWNRPMSVLENEETQGDNTAHQSAERAEIQASNFVSPSERNAAGSQESWNVQDSISNQQQSRDPMSEMQTMKEEKPVQSHPANQESQRGDVLFSSGPMTSTDDGGRQRWTQQEIASQQVGNRESVESSNSAKESSFGDLREQNVPRNPGYIENVVSENINTSAESKKNTDLRGSVPRGDWEVARESQQGRTQGGWGLPNKKTEELRPEEALQLSPPVFAGSENQSQSIPQSQFGRVAQGQETRQAPSAGHSRVADEAPGRERSNPPYQIQQERPIREDEASGVEFGHREQVGEKNTVNDQSVTRHQRPSFENGDPAVSTAPQPRPPNPPHGSRSDGPRPSLPQSQYPNSQNPSHKIRPPQAQYPNSQYQRPPQYTNYNYNPQPEMYNQPRYNQQPSVGDTVTTVLEDGTAAVKDVLGKSWQGLVGFSSRTREAMGQARDQVVTGASVAGQSISAKSTNLWGQAKSAFGSVFEKSDDTAQSQYNMSNQYGGQPQQRYPEGQSLQRQPQQRYPEGQSLQRQPQQRYPEGQSSQSYGRTPPTHQPPRARGQVPRGHEHGRQRSLDRHGVQGQRSQPQPQGQQYHPQNGQIRRPGMQTRYDPPSPQHGQARPTPQPYQNQYQHPPRHPSFAGQQDQPVDRRPHQSMQDKHPDPWSHPGLSGDV